MKLMNLEDVPLPVIQAFKESFNLSKNIIHGSYQLQTATDLKKWQRELIIVKEKDYKQTVRTSHFGLVDENGVMIGLSDIKHHLTGYLQKEGGHISYSIAPPFQGYGYGSYLLDLTLKEAKKFGFTHVLLTCRSDNPTSIKVIEKNGGVFIRQLTINRYNVNHYHIYLDNDNFFM